MTSPVGSDAAHSSIGVDQALRDMRVITRRNLLRFARMPQLLLFATIQPVMFLLLFNFVFGGAHVSVAQKLCAVARSPFVLIFH